MVSSYEHGLLVYNHSSRIGITTTIKRSVTVKQIK